MGEFKVKDYVNALGIALVNEFNTAKLATQSVAIGSNKESSVISKLSSILPEGIGVGSGFVYDAYGNVSNQCDIILYEKGFALKCCINENSKDTYYNCESVIAVGEIKSVCGEREVRDTFKKFNNLAKLNRYFAKEDLDSARSYLSKNAVVDSLDGTPLERNEYDRIFKFLLCEKYTVDLLRTHDLIEEISETDDSVLNYLLDIEGRQMIHLDSNNAIRLGRSKKMAFVEGGFSDFIYLLLHFVGVGRTAPINYGVYLKTFDRKSFLECYDSEQRLKVVNIGK